MRPGPALSTRHLRGRQPRLRAIGLVATALALLALGCGKSVNRTGTGLPPPSRPVVPAPSTAAPTSTSAPVTTAPATTTVPPTTKAPTTAKASTPTTKPWAPSSPQPSPAQATYDLLGAWAEHARSLALRYASPGAVSALFARPYPSGGFDYRGCSSPPSTEPATCSVRTGDNLLQLTAVSFPHGWGITAAIFES